MQMLRPLARNLPFTDTYILFSGFQRRIRIGLRTYHRVLPFLYKVDKLPNY